MGLGVVVESTLACFSGGGRGWMATEGEADAARNCSSRLGAAMGDGGGLANAGEAGFAGGWKGSVEGSDGCLMMLG